MWKQGKEAADYLFPSAQGELHRGPGEVVRTIGCSVLLSHPQGTPMLTRGVVPNVIMNQSPYDTVKMARAVGGSR